MHNTVEHNAATASTYHGLEAWNDHVRTLGSISLRNSCALLNPQVIHGLFGKPDQQLFRLYMIKDLQTVDQKVKFKVAGSFHQTLELAFATVSQTKPPSCWYYLPDKKYIIYIEGQNMLCVDYGHFDDAETLVVEFLKLPRHPLTNFADLQLMVNNCHEFIQAVRERQRLLSYLAPLPNDKIVEMKAFDIAKCCNRCRRTTETALEISCSRCKAAYYCNRSCQGKDLPKHKLDCVEVRVQNSTD